MIRAIIKKDLFLYPISFLYSLVFSPNCIFNSKIHRKGAFLKNVKLKVKGKNSQVHIGKMARLRDCEISISNSSSFISIGGGHSIISSASFVCEDEGSSITIGKDFTMEGGHIASTEGCSITIGNDCMFSGDIEIRNGDSHSIIEKGTNKRVNQAAPVTIGEHVWLTAHVRILKGATIPPHCVIGNSSIVTSVLTEPYALYAGSPAKLISQNKDWDRNRYKFKK